MKEPQTKEEVYWYNVGGIAGLLAFSFLILPILFFTYPAQLVDDKILKCIIVMVGSLPYLIVLFIKREWFLRFCTKIAINMTKKKEEKQVGS